VGKDKSKKRGWEGVIILLSCHSGRCKECHIYTPLNLLFLEGKL